MQKSGETDQVMGAGGGGTVVVIVIVMAVIVIVIVVVIFIVMVIVTVMMMSVMVTLPLQGSQLCAFMGIGNSDQVSCRRKEVGKFGCHCKCVSHTDWLSACHCTLSDCHCLSLRHYRSV